ncbi:type II toxin-antitoxin system VapC family toxin (plasmid) [Streptomyces sp. JL4002]|uniref:type II toxin-antitoxin system VapC family toxin n=1 Tax=Streptomyces sp. JL4002 TaxID=3404781 RepID=UPI003B27FC9B
MSGSLDTNVLIGIHSQLKRGVGLRAIIEGIVKLVGSSNLFVTLQVRNEFTQHFSASSQKTMAQAVLNRLNKEFRVHLLDEGASVELQRKYQQWSHRAGRPLEKLDLLVLVQTIQEDIDKIVTNDRRFEEDIKSLRADGVKAPEVIRWGVQ